MAFLPVEYREQIWLHPHPWPWTHHDCEVRVLEGPPGYHLSQRVPVADLEAGRARLFARLYEGVALGIPLFQSLCTRESTG